MKGYYDLFRQDMIDIALVRHTAVPRSRDPSDVCAVISSTPG